MPKKKLTYEELLKENLSLKLKLSVAEDESKLLEQMKYKNAMLEELNEELKQTSDKLKKSKDEYERVNNLYNILAKNISDVIWIIDLKGKFLYVSPSAYSLYGYNEKEVLDIQISDILVEESYEKQKIAFAQRLENENRGVITGDTTYIWRQKKKNGQLLWVEVVATPLRDNRNKMYALIGVSRDVTSRLNAEENLKKLAVAVEQNPASIVITGIDGSIEYVNSAFTINTGYSSEEVLGKDPKILKSGLTPQSTYRLFWNTIISGNTWQGEFINKKKNGKIFYEHATVAPIFDSNGEITNFVAIKENITQQKFKEQELNDSRKRFQMLSDISLEGIMVFENELVYDVNKSLGEITGYSPEELLGTDPLVKLVDANSIQEIKEKIKTAIHHPFEAKGVKKNGQQYPVELEIRHLNYSERNLKIIALRDISYRKRVEDVLRSSLELAEMLANNTEKQIIDHGLEEAVRLSESKIGFFHFVNEDQETVTLHTWSKETLKNCNIPEILTNYPVSEAGTWIDSFHEKKAIIHNDYKSLPHKRGLPEGHFPLIRYVSLPVIEDDKVKIIFGVGNKTEDYNQFDVDILTLFAKTIWMVLQRKRTEIKLTKANETKAKFLSIISHDLRSPIGSINSLTDMILDNIEILNTDELSNFIKVINQTSKNTFDQLENMLIWSRAQSDNIEFNPQLTSLSSIIKSQIQSVEYLLKKKDLKLVQNINNEVLVNIDQNMINSVVRNLLTNAIKFTPRNGNVTIELRQDEEKTVEVIVSDTGVGIEPERINKLFSMNNNSTTFGTEKEKGSGLGLLLCKEFVERNGGKIWVESTPGKGSQFYFSLPISK
jgi:PAS domain S-box-containing protein